MHFECESRASSWPPAWRPNSRPKLLTIGALTIKEGLGWHYGMNHKGKLLVIIPTPTLWFRALATLTQDSHVSRNQGQVAYFCSKTAAERSETLVSEC